MKGKEGGEANMSQFPNHLNHLNELNQIQPLPGRYKILTEIAHSKLDFHLSKKIKISKRVNKILDINWAPQPVDYHISLSSNRLWMSGKLSAEITYTKRNDGQVHLQTIFFPWKTATSIGYLSSPILPRSNEKKQYEFNDPYKDEETTAHYEQMIYHNEMPLLEIISTKVVTSQSIRKTEEAPNLILEVNCEMEFRILQYQLIQNNSQAL